MKKAGNRNEIKHLEVFLLFLVFFEPRLRLKSIFTPQKFLHKKKWLSTKREHQRFMILPIFFFILLGIEHSIILRQNIARKNKDTLLRIQIIY